MKHTGMRPQDVLILLKVIIHKEGRLFQKDIAHDLQISPSEVSESLFRSSYAGLIKRKSLNIKRKTFLEFIIYGLPYVFPAIKGTIVKGVPTGASAPPLNEFFNQAIPYVWPSRNATHQGISIEPLYKSVPVIAVEDHSMYRVLALVDAIRIGHTREKRLAIQHLENII